MIHKLESGTTVYIVRLSQGILEIPVQQGRPEGPLVFLCYDDAVAMAVQVGGQVETRTAEYMFHGSGRQGKSLFIYAGTAMFVVVGSLYIIRRHNGRD